MGWDVIGRDVRHGRREVAAAPTVPWVESEVLPRFPLAGIVFWTSRKILRLFFLASECKSQRTGPLAGLDKCAHHREARFVVGRRPGRPPLLASFALIAPSLRARKLSCGPHIQSEAAPTPSDPWGEAHVEARCGGVRSFDKALAGDDEGSGRKV